MKLSANPVGRCYRLAAIINPQQAPFCFLYTSRFYRFQQGTGRLRPVAVKPSRETTIAATTRLGLSCCSFCDEGEPARTAYDGCDTASHSQPKRR